MKLKWTQMSRPEVQLNLFFPLPFQNTPISHHDKTSAFGSLLHDLHFLECIFLHTLKNEKKLARPSFV